VAADSEINLIEEGMKKLLITGGLERPGGFELGDGKCYGEGVLLKLDLETGETEKILSMKEGNEHYPDLHPNLQFTAGFVEPGYIWLPTDTEIRQYKYPDLSLVRTISKPFFQNIHSVTIFDETIYCTSTGLDLVAMLDKQSGETIELVNVEGKDAWNRFSKNIDYRLVHSTRPHHGHPNYIFKYENEVWVTRCTQEDAVVLKNIEKRIDISGPSKTISVHDGHVVGDHVFFTSVDGKVLIADIKSKKVIKEVDLYKSEKNKKSTKGWCRGLLVYNEIIYVAFSKLRNTRNPSKIAWLKEFVKKDISNASIIAYDRYTFKKLKEYLIPVGSIDAIYSVLPEPPPLMA